MAGGAEGDGEGTCSESYMPTCSASEEVVANSRQPGSGSIGQRPHRWRAGVPLGKIERAPQWNRRGAASDRIPGGLQAPMAWYPGPSATHVRSARRVRTRSDRNERAASGAPVSVRVYPSRGVRLQTNEPTPPKQSTSKLTAQTHMHNPTPPRVLLVMVQRESIEIQPGPAPRLFARLQPARRSELVRGSPRMIAQGFTSTQRATTTRPCCSRTQGRARCA